MSDDLRFDALLTEGADALPPAPDVSPWRSAMYCIAWGIALKTLTLQILYLDDILPTLGCILLVLGFRTLRQENGALRWAYGLSIAAAVMRSAAMVLAALPVDVGLTFGYADSALMLGMLIALWRGMTGVSRAAGAEKPSAPAAGSLAVFYAVLIPLAFIGLEGWLLVLPVLAVYLVILRNLVKLFRSLENTGYAIHAAPVHLPTAAVLWGYLGLTLAAVVLAMLLGQRYPMDWQVRDDAPQDAAIRAELLELGFPRDVLDDLTAEEVAQMSGALKVYTETQTNYDKNACRTVTTDKWYTEMPANWQYYRTTVEADGARRYTYRIYDVPVSVMTHAAVEVPGEQGLRRYIILHHVRYADTDGFRGTEGLQIWPSWRVETDWFTGDWVSGRVLCSRSGQPCASDFCRLEGGMEQSASIFGTEDVFAITARWTRPAGGEDLRAYVLYDALRGEDGDVLGSVVNTFRRTAPNYPFADAYDSWQRGQRGHVDWRQDYFQLWLYSIENEVRSN